jgi:hypothetical protein
MFSLGIGFYWSFEVPHGGLRQNIEIFILFSPINFLFFDHQKCFLDPSFVFHLLNPALHQTFHSGPIDVSVLNSEPKGFYNSFIMMFCPFFSLQVVRWPNDWTGVEPREGDG